MEQRECCRGTAGVVGVQKHPQVKVSEVVGVTHESDLVVVDPFTICKQCAPASEKFGFEHGFYPRTFPPLLDVSTNQVGMVMQVNKYIFDARVPKVVEPDIEHRAASDWHETLRDGVRKRAEPCTESARQQERFHRTTERTTPRLRIRLFASSRIESRPSIPASQLAYSSTESAGVRRGVQPSDWRAEVSE